MRNKFDDIVKAIGWISKDKKVYLREFGFVAKFKESCDINRLRKFQQKMKVKKKKLDKYSAWNFLHKSYTFFDASSTLVQTEEDLFLFIETSVVLGHIGLELLLKGFLVWDEIEIPYTHNLLDLAKKTDFIQLELATKKLQKIETFFSYRYPLDAQDFEKQRLFLEKINFQTIPGVVDLPHELGTPDLELIDEIHFSLSMRSAKYTYDPHSK